MIIVGPNGHPSVIIRTTRANPAITHGSGWEMSGVGGGGRLPARVRPR